ncbi:unnamed protein product [Larinioides sclopetarius]|uniref:Uncharacterized protein n=1 Tax=Larinioides sclopetarius TaxID=280406 RepID=A0AAV2B5F9_9ARAC
MKMIIYLYLLMKIRRSVTTGDRLDCFLQKKAVNSQLLQTKAANSQLLQKKAVNSQPLHLRCSPPDSSQPLHLRCSSPDSSQPLHLRCSSLDSQPWLPHQDEAIQHWPNGS